MTLHEQRLANWCQTPETRIPGPEAAIPLIERVGMATLFPASPEIPNLYHAYMGDPEAATQSEWDSPSGKVYEWRWTLGRQEAAFYTAIVRKRPTWVSWALLPVVLRLRGELRTSDELYDAGVLSANAYKITQVLDEAGGTLSTGDLRREAGFPTGKEQRAAYLKAVDELDGRMLLAKVFSPGEMDMGHALVSIRYPEHVEAAERMTRQEALRRFLLTYLPQAVYIVPAVLARHLKLPESEVCAGVEELAQEGLISTVAVPGRNGPCHAWQAGAQARKVRVG